MNTCMELNLNKNWIKALQPEFEKKYFTELITRVDLEYQTKKIFPLQTDIFNAFNFCQLPNIKVVILGQDPYHENGQAHGLAFSVPENISIPPSLKNIFKEIKSDIGTDIPTSGNLEKWSTQGVLLLNSTLTVEEGSANSHAKFDWQSFTDAVIKLISKEQKHVVFLLWGAFAQSKRPLIDETRHFILTAPHPSPLSAHRGFFGCKHFSQTNNYLTKNKQTPIIW